MKAEQLQVLLYKEADRSIQRSSLDLLDARQWDNEEHLAFYMTHWMTIYKLT